MVHQGAGADRDGAESKAATREMNTVRTIE
jgi:hypothetical protein